MNKIELSSRMFEWLTIIAVLTVITLLTAGIAIGLHLRAPRTPIEYTTSNGSILILVPGDYNAMYLLDRNYKVWFPPTDEASKL